jgi:hypothetical protein
VYAQLAPLPRNDKISNINLLLLVVLNKPPSIYVVVLYITGIRLFNFNGHDFERTDFSFSSGKSFASSHKKMYHEILKCYTARGTYDFCEIEKSIHLIFRFVPALIFACGLCEGFSICRACFYKCQNIVSVY